MRDKLWVVLEPSVPDRDVIAKHFFKTGKKGNQTFKTGKAIIHFHISNEIYDTVLENLKRVTDEWPPEKNTARKPAGRKVTVRDKDIEPSMAADFTVGILINLMCLWCLQTIVCC